MIQKEDVSEVGKILKPHGVKGELTVLFNQPQFADIESSFYFLLLDGIYIPFFVEEFRYNSNVTARIKFEEINAIEQASNYNNKSVFLPAKLVRQPVKELSSEWHQFIDYTVLDENNNLIGEIRDIDSSTINVLFIVEKEGQDEILLPATTDFILKVDPNKKQIHLNLPDGLLDSSLT